MAQQPVQGGTAEARKHAGLWWAVGGVALLLAVAVILLVLILLRSQPVVIPVNVAAPAPTTTTPSTTSATPSEPTPEQTEAQLAALAPTRPLIGTYEFSGGFAGGSGSGDFTAFAGDERLFTSKFGSGNAFTSTGLTSPNGRYLAITVLGGSPELYVSKIDGSELRKVTSPLPMSYGEVVWAPDSAALYFRTFDDEAQKEVLNVFDLATDDTLQYDRNNEQSYDLVAADSDELFVQIYNARHLPESTSLHAVPVRANHVLSGDAKAVLIDHGQVRQVAVSPDGRHVASVHNAPCPSDLPIEEVCTGKPQLLDVLDRSSGESRNLVTAEVQSLSYPLFTPDSGSVVYSSTDYEAGFSSIDTIRVNGTGLRSVVVGSASAEGYAPYFGVYGVSTDGGTMALSYYSASGAAQYPRVATVAFASSSQGVQDLELLGPASKPVEFFGWTQ